MTKLPELTSASGESPVAGAMTSWIAQPVAGVAVAQFMPRNYAAAFVSWRLEFSGNRWDGFVPATHIVENFPRQLGPLQYFLGDNSQGRFPQRSTHMLLFCSDGCFMLTATAIFPVAGRNSNGCRALGTRVSLSQPHCAWEVCCGNRSLHAKHWVW